MPHMVCMSPLLHGSATGVALLRVVMLQPWLQLGMTSTIVVLQLMVCMPSVFNAIKPHWGKFRNPALEQNHSKQRWHALHPWNHGKCSILGRPNGQSPGCLRNSLTQAQGSTARCIHDGRSTTFHVSVRIRPYPAGLHESLVVLSWAPQVVL